MSFFLVWHHKIISFFFKQLFLQFLRKTTALIRFHLLVLALNYRILFSWPDNVTSPHLLLCDITLLSVLIENVVLEVSQENKLTTLLWAQNKTSFWRSDDVIMTSQAPRPKARLGQPVFYSLTHRKQYSAVKHFSEKNAERFEIATCLHAEQNILRKYLTYIFFQL